MSFDELHRAAVGRWHDILAGLGIDPAALRNVHGPCPGCGGRDRFRFDDRDGHGTWICGGGGDVQSGDGFGLLAHVHGYGAAEALQAVAGFLGIDPTSRFPAAPTRRLTRDLAAVLAHELVVLYIALSDRLDGLAGMDDTDREREARAIIRAGWREAGL